MIRVYVAKSSSEEENPKKQSARARRLLDMALKKEYPSVCAPVRVEKDTLGKPYLPDYPQICVSISHSGPYVACALGEKPVGVDVEVWKKRKTLGRIVEKLHPLEREAYVRASEEKKEEIFFGIWVQKESFG